MPASMLAATAMPTLRVLVLTGGVVAAVVVLSLVTGRWARRRGGASRRDPVGPAWTAAAPPRPNEEVAAPADCGWAASWDPGDGQPWPLRHPAGRACCHYVLGVRELAPVGTSDEREDVLGWTGARTRIGAGGASTPTTVDVVSRRSAARAGGLDVGVGIDRTAGPTVTTPPWRRAVDGDGPVPNAPEEAAARLWACHVDDLRGRGVRPVPADGPSVVVGDLRRRFEVVLRVERGCRTVPPRASVEVSVTARLSASVSAGAARMAVPTLVSWASVDGRVVTADTPTTVPTGLVSWSRVTTGDGAGVQATVAPSSQPCEVTWSGQWAGVVDATDLHVAAGSAVALGIEGVGDGAVPASARLDAVTAARVRLHVDQPDPVDRTSACPRCVPDLVVEIALGDDMGARPDAHGSTSEGTIGLDGHALRLYAPTPESGRESWTVATGDTAERTHASDDAHEVR